MARSLKDAHMPPVHDWEPEHGDDSGDDADDEESPFGDFLESHTEDDDEIIADMKEMRLALEYLRGVLSASKAQRASTSKAAAEKADDEKGVHAEDSVVDDDDDDDDFVFLESDEDDDKTQDISRSCLELLIELDYIMLPTVGVDLFRAEMEFMLLGDKDCAVNGGGAASPSARVRSKWQLLYEKFYDEDKKSFKEVDLDSWRREVVQTCGDLFKDVCALWNSESVGEVADGFGVADFF
ncbi:hypothetical protein M440DRAFT_20286 [Trichoderma longibrachiatum ATCC 18648]|uniref:Uncharacterized protein n=1 Tax=Trichoderma longibrachiatum ATCC 18648 TaxID=983965 RepID=A0A2T4C0M3_TRILO|nr:hypothetical protein M440DRAFT_20286 [Trichoderma longibrachiatum ATCC 18648]